MRKKWEVLRRSKFHDQHYIPIVSELDDFTIKTDIAWVIDSDSVDIIAAAPELFYELIISIERGIKLGYSCEDQLVLYKKITGEEYEYVSAINKAIGFQ